MFTGLIQQTGLIISKAKNAEGASFVIHADKLAGQMKIDDSIAVNGVCLTATSVEALVFPMRIKASASM